MRLTKSQKDLVDVKLRKRAYGKEWVLVEKKKSKKSKNNCFYSFNTYISALTLT